jgi:RNA polymerase sigma-70 factor (ECF subfamily)
MAAALEQQQADLDLIHRVARGDQAAFAQLYDRLSGPLYSVALRMIGDAGEAEDALQDVFVMIWRRANTYDAARSSVFSWAVLQTRSRVIDRLRSRGRRARLVVASTDDENSGIQVVDASTSDTAADTAALNDEAARMRSKFETLPPDQRQAIDLAFFRNLTHNEIASQLQQPLGTIKARIRRGLLRLREEMQTS